MLYASEFFMAHNSLCTLNFLQGAHIILWILLSLLFIFAHKKKDKWLLFLYVGTAYF